MNLQGRNLERDLKGDDVRLLHDELALLGMEVTKRERRDGVFGVTTAKLIALFQRQEGIEPTGVVNATTARAINRVVARGSYTVEGRVASPDRAGVGGLLVEIVDKNVGEDVPLAEAETDRRGAYHVEFSGAPLRERGKQHPDLQARVFSRETFLGASEVRYNASTRETLNVLLPAGLAALPSEHETLTTAVTAHFDGNLGDLNETDDQHDITYLSNKTGWDARAVAMGALADQFSRKEAEGASDSAIPAPFYYALFRAGLPANQETLYRASADIVEDIWKQAIDQGVISPELEQQMLAAKVAFQAHATATVLDAQALPGASTMGELLTVSLGDSSEQKAQFAELYTAHSGNLEAFWGAAEETFGPETTQRLKLDGQLATLTRNNASLIGRLHETENGQPLTSMLDLARRGYHRTDKWAELLDDAVPETVPGETDDERRVNYAELLSAQVKLSFPTAVVADMIQAGNIPLTEDAELQDGVTTFLTEHQGAFEIGMQPVGQFIVRNDLGDQVDAGVVTQIKRLQRVYQITPTDDALGTLLSHDLDSAFRISRYGEAEFVNSLGAELGESQARHIHTKALQVHNATLNIATSYLTMQNAPGIGSTAQALIIGSPPDGEAGGAEHAADVIAYPTLEGLFGSMDFCDCDHCRSNLSPAAYMVDLLQFIDRPENVKENPLTVLLDRRPDLQHLPLTCENTHTRLPYIDVVNEALEYFIVNELSLDDYQGHSTDDTVTSEVLLASPQYVNDTAYTTVMGELFPPPLPFHRPLAAIRRHFAEFETPLHEVMEALRADDAVERASEDAYAWRDILMERLGLSRAEYRLLTDRTVTLPQLYGFPAGTSDAEARAQLANARAFSRRVGLSYEDVVELLRTRFINPGSTLLPRLERLHVPFSTLRSLKDGEISDAEFDALLPVGLDQDEYGGDVKAWVRDDENFDRIMGLITLTDPTNSTDPCAFENFEFRYTNPDNAANQLRSIDYVRLARFIRLWKALGWTIAQTDIAITALYPAEEMPEGADEAVDLEHLDTGFLMFLPRLGVMVDLLDRLKLHVDRDLAGLLACWSPIDSHGAGSLYRRMFLNPAIPARDPVFADDGFGNVPADAAAKLLAHEETLRAAFNLTGAEFAKIVSDALDFDDTTTITLPNISTVYRWAWLARTLRLSVHELALLVRFTGIDPFASPDPANPPITRFIDLIEKLDESSLKTVEALYPIWNQDVSGTSVPEEQEITEFARTLRADFAAIHTEFAIVDDPTGEIARERMALVYGVETTDFFFGLLNNTLITEVPYDHPQPALEEAIPDIAPGRIGYDDFRKRLTFSSVLSTATRDALKAVVGVPPEFQAAVDALFDASQATVAPFFARYPELEPLHDAYVVSAEPPETRRQALLENFLPELERRRKQQQALAGITAAAGTESTLAPLLLQDPSALHANRDTGRPAQDDLTTAETGGFSARYFFRKTATGNLDLTVEAVPSLSFAADSSNELPDNGAVAGDPISGVWSGYLDAPESGFYNLLIDTEPGASVSLALNGSSVTLAQNGAEWSNQNPIELTAGVLAAIELAVENVRETLTVRWATTGLGREVIPPSNLYPSILFDDLRTTWIRFFKAASLAEGLELTPAEIAHIATRPEHQIDGHGWLNALPVEGDPDTATAAALRDVLIALLDVAWLKATLSEDDEHLLAVLRNPDVTLPNGDSLLLTLTGWEATSLDALLTRVGKTRNDLTHVEVFRRVYDAFAHVNKLGIGADALIRATTNEPDADTVRDLQSALRARYDEHAWLDVVKPTNDELRGLQRDALVAYVLRRLSESEATRHIDTPDKLYEFFLMDVQMDPCRETSRIRLALSTIQLFIERCLMNLETRVSPSSIRAEQWEWMKRYRVWEANRKVFLWPENWLFPELRDDQSPFFKEIMSELLQSDITEDAAATALGNYLTKLEEVAKLEPCGVYYEEKEPGLGDDVTHVVARTAGANRKYYYRRRESGSWTPWEQIKLEIEDNPVIPVVWKHRLFLFWLRILGETPIDASDLSTSSTADGELANLTMSEIKVDAGAGAKKQKVTVKAVLCWSEYYNGKWQPAKTSDVDRPTRLGEFKPAGPEAFDRSELILSTHHVEDALRVSISGEGGSSFLLYNTHSLPVRFEDQESNQFVFIFPQRGRSISSEDRTLSITYSPGGFIIFGIVPANWLFRDVLTSPLRFSTVEPWHQLDKPWDAPFFFADSRHLFYVRTSHSTTFVPEFPTFGGVTDLVVKTKKIPELVQETGPRLEGIDVVREPIIGGIGDGVTDPVPIRRFVTLDTNIHTAIGTTTPVRFGEHDIGPAGVLNIRRP